MGNAMKKILLAVVGAAALFAGGPASAADIYRGPPPPPPPVVFPIYNWTGFYVGGNIGGAWRHDDFTDTLFGVDFSDNNRGVFIGGGQVGFNYQFFNGFVLGAEFDFDWAANNNNTSDTIFTAFGPLQATANNRWVSTLAARFGWAFDRWLIYGKAGGGWVGNDNFTITNTQTGASFNFSNNSDNVGWLVGVGTEWAFAGPWSARIEYDYLGLNSRTFNGDGVIFPITDTFNSGNRNIQMVTFGINYRFGWGGPVVARY
jgi:outer membrane immunogenic protein